MAKDLRIIKVSSCEECPYGDEDYGQSRRHYCGHYKSDVDEWGDPDTGDSWTRFCNQVQKWCPLEKGNVGENV